MTYLCDFWIFKNHGVKIMYEYTVDYEGLECNTSPVHSELCHTQACLLRIFTQANTQDNEKQNKKETITGRQLSRTPKIFKKSVTKEIKKKIKRWFRIEMKNQSSLQFLEVMKVLSD